MTVIGSDAVPRPAGLTARTRIGYGVPLDKPLTVPVTVPPVPLVFSVVQVVPSSTEYS